MRRPALFATLVFALAVVPALAQRGGGHGGASFGGMRGGASFHNPGFRGSGFRNGSFSSPGFRNLNSGRRGFSHNPFLHNRGFQGNRFNSFHHGRNDFRFRSRFRNCFGFNCGWGWPWWGWDSGLWDSDSSYDQDRANDLAIANEMNQQNLEEQRQRRQEDAYSNTRPDARPQPREDARSDPPDPSTVLVFRDQHRQEIQNYAIVGATLWAFAPQRTQKISLADLDIPATTRANDNRGLDFHVPGE